MNKAQKDRLLIFDTTLRDGEQSAGAAMSAAEKLKIASQLERLGVDIIEAGFPAASPGDLEAVSSIAAQAESATICALARASDADIDSALAAIAQARRPRLHTFIATSPQHMARKLGLQPEEVIERAVHAVRRARNGVEDVEFSPEDAVRSDPDFLCRVIEAAIEAGATTINIPDTVGYTLPDRFAGLIASLIERIPNSDRAVFSVHCHDDLGMAVANSLAAVGAGARQVECTINGIGERAGNAALEEIVMAVRTRADLFACDTGVDAGQLVPTSRLVSSITGMLVQPNKAIVGANAFAHESGIHQDGVLKSRENYEIMRAEDVGWSSNRIQLGKLSGRNALRDRLAHLGFAVDDDELREIFARFKRLADKKREIFDDDLVSLVTETAAAGGHELAAWSCSSGSDATPRAEVTVRLAGGAEKSAAAEGDGQVDAMFRAIEQIVGFEASLESYAVQAITGGTDAQGEVVVKVARDGGDGFRPGIRHRHSRSLRQGLSGRPGPAGGGRPPARRRGGGRCGCRCPGLNDGQSPLPLRLSGHEGWRVPMRPQSGHICTDM